MLNSILVWFSLTVKYFRAPMSMCHIWIPNWLLHKTGILEIHILCMCSLIFVRNYGRYFEIKIMREKSTNKFNEMYQAVAILFQEKWKFAFTRITVSYSGRKKLKRLTLLNSRSKFFPCEHFPNKSEALLMIGGYPWKHWYSPQFLTHLLGIILGRYIMIF